MPGRFFVDETATGQVELLLSEAVAAEPAGLSLSLQMPLVVEATGGVLVTLEQLEHVHHLSIKCAVRCRLHLKVSGALKTRAARSAHSCCRPEHGETHMHHQIS